MPAPEPSDHDGPREGDVLDSILRQVERGELDAATAAARLRGAAVRPIGAGRGAEARIDIDREGRCGFPEVVLCEGKEPDQAAAIAVEILAHSPRVLLTRASAAHAEALLRLRPDAFYDARSRCLAVDPEPLPALGAVAVVAAGTGDIPVAEEAAQTARIMGAHVISYHDVGIAGLHRLLDVLPDLRTARVIVAVAGMEGALASVLGGLVDRPVIGVPTSVGYGVHLGGLTPLLAMLDSCAAGVGVVNIDNGFGGGYLAALINRVGAPPAHSTAAGDRQAGGS